MTEKAGTVKVRIAGVKPLEDSGLFDAALRIASPERRAKALRYRFDRDRRLSLGADLGMIIRDLAE